jgi:general secretion pathway protein K
MKLQVQRGAAILTAMLIVTLVASITASALWQQWRSIEIESAERARVQSSWILQGALDWGRLILREDARSGTPDHLAEPWAVPLKEARLSTFLAAGRTSDTVEDLSEEAFLSGQISDLQGRLNVKNLIQDGQPHPPSVRAFVRLFDALNLPQAELNTLIQNMRLAQEISIQADSSKNTPFSPLLPRTIDQLGWLGVSNSTIARLRDYVTVLPERTTVNLNTAPALVLFACIGAIDQATAQRMVAARSASHFKSLSDAANAIGGRDINLVQEEHGINSRFFEMRAYLRINQIQVKEYSVVQRDGLTVKTLWRQKGTVRPNPPLK